MFLYVESRFTVDTILLTQHSIHAGDLPLNILDDLPVWMGMLDQNSPICRCGPGQKMFRSSECVRADTCLT